VSTSEPSLEQLTGDALAKVKDASSLAELDDIRVGMLGKKGALTAQLKSLGALPAEERPAAGQKINEAKQQVKPRFAAQ